MDSLYLHGVGNYNIPDLLTSSTYTKFSDMFLHVCTGGIMALKINTIFWNVELSPIDWYNQNIQEWNRNLNTMLKLVYLYPFNE
jgi:hypothetical protein